LPKSMKFPLKKATLGPTHDHGAGAVAAQEAAATPTKPTSPRTKASMGHGPGSRQMLLKL